MGAGRYWFALVGGGIGLTIAAGGGGKGGDPGGGGGGHVGRRRFDACRL